MNLHFNTDSIGSFFQDILKLSYFQLDPAYDNTPAIEANLDEGQGKLILITGDNASGKSFVRRLVTLALRKMDMECMHVSQEGRATGGIQRAFIYGAEDWESTGYISVGTMRKGIKTSRNRENRHAFFFDEPDIGLSDNYAAGLGVQLLDFLTDSPEKLYMICLVSHRKALIEQLLPLKPWNLRLGGCPDLETWLKAPIIPTDPEKLHEEGLKRFRRISKFLK